MNEIKPLIEMRIDHNDHDINVSDSKHSDNSVTMTKEEARWVTFKLMEVLGIKSN